MLVEGLERRSDNLPNNISVYIDIPNKLNNFERKIVYMGRGRIKGTKDKDKPFTGTKQYHLRVDTDVEKFLYSQKQIVRYLNDLIRKDMYRAIETGEYCIEGQSNDKSDVKTMNTYNFVEKGCIFYHAIAESEEQAVELAQGAGFDIEGMGIELGRMNVRDELGRPYSPRIEECLVH